MTRTWPQQEKLTLLFHKFLQQGFPVRLYNLEYDIFILYIGYAHCLIDLLILDYWMKDYCYILPDTFVAD